MDSKNCNSIHLRKVLTKRFVLAMAIVCCTSLLSVIAIFALLQEVERDARLINISGRQRMLSQRIALLASLAAQETGPAREATLVTLNDAINTMAQAHAELSTDSQTSATRSSMFQDEQGLDHLVAAYLSAAQAAAAEPDSVYRLLVLQEMATHSDLLEKLNAVVAAYEAEYDGRKLDWFRTLELALLLASFLTIGAVAMFVFRPTIRLVSSTLESLERSNAELTEFSYRISHDLRAPVVSALGVSEIAKLSLEERDLETAETALGHVRTSLSRLSLTIDDISGLIKQRLVDVAPEQFKLSDLVHDSIESVQHLPDFDQVDLQVDCPLDLQLRSKRMIVQRTIENLISNAVKYRDPHESKSRISILATMEGETCHIAVSDNGLGIGEEYRERLFSMFQRFHPQVSFGSGLGLYLVKQNVASLSGAIEYQPREKGSTFRFSFPTLGA